MVEDYHLLPQDTAGFMSCVDGTYQNFMEDQGPGLFADKSGYAYAILCQGKNGIVSYDLRLFQWSLSCEPVDGGLKSWFESQVFGECTERQGEFLKHIREHGTLSMLVEMLGDAIEWRGDTPGTTLALPNSSE